MLWSGLAHPTDVFSSTTWRSLAFSHMRIAPAQSSTELSFEASFLQTYLAREALGFCVSCSLRVSIQSVPISNRSIRRMVYFPPSLAHRARHRSHFLISQLTCSSLGESRLGRGMSSGRTLTHCLSSYLRVAGSSWGSNHTAVSVSLRWGTARGSKVVRIDHSLCKNSSPPSPHMSVVWAAYHFYSQEWIFSGHGYSS